MANTEKPVKQFAFLKLQRDSVERKKGIAYYKTFESELGLVHTREKTCIFF